MATLVTGAGLIGAAFAQAAATRGEEVVFLDPEPREAFLRRKLPGGFETVRRDVRDLPGLIEILQAGRFEAVVHTAGLIGSRVQESLSTGFDVNVGGSRNVAEALRLSGVPKLVYVSTFGVYDRRLAAAAPLSETFPRGGARAYGASKAATELLLEAYADAHGFELVILRPANVFGAGHFWSGSSGGRKLQALVEAGLSGKPAKIAPADAFDNEYVYALDVGRAVDRAVMAEPLSERAFNIGSGVITPFSEVVAAARASLPGLTVEFGPGDAPQSKAQPLDISRADRLLGWRPAFDLKDAFSHFVQELRAARA